MRIRSIKATNVPPVDHFEVDGLTDVVVLAGRNGVGKTRFVQALIAALRNPKSVQSNIEIVLEATSSDERKQWGTDTLATSDAGQGAVLLQTLQANRRRIKWRSSILQFESDRSVQRVQPLAFSWDIVDPWEEAVSWDQTFGTLRDRFQDTVHSLFRKVQSRDRAIAREANKLMDVGRKRMTLDFPDPLEPFKEAFSLLLSPKTLIDPDPRNQQLRYHFNDTDFPIDSLSSGEREVVNIVFDFLLRRPSDCIVFFDEPELHLHPELSFKLLQTLQSVAGQNQFVFCTHSPDIITASLDQSVVFVGPPTDPPSNQAIPVREDDDTNQALRLLGQSIGIVALGRRLVLIEGENTSLDKKTYGSILGDRHSDLVLVPAGGRDQLVSFGTLYEKVLKQTIWGVEFFMLCDRDAVPPGADIAEVEGATAGRLRVLPRYHIENFFLEEHLLAEVFRDLEPGDSWLRDPAEVRKVLIELCMSTCSYVASLYVAARLRRTVGNVDLMPKGVHDKDLDAIKVAFDSRASAERKRVGDCLAVDDVRAAVEQQYNTLHASLSTEEWKALYPGKVILGRFASKAGLDASRLKRRYLHIAAEAGTSPFAPILDIFRDFSDLADAS